MAIYTLSTGPSKGPSDAHFGASREPRRPRSQSPDGLSIATSDVAHAPAFRTPQSMQDAKICPDLGTFEVPSQTTAPERCALGHHSSPFRRFGVIYGVPEASRTSSFDPSAQSLHLMTSMLSRVSSRDLSLILYLILVSRRFGASPRASTAPAARSSSLHRVSIPSRSEEQLESLRTGSTARHGGWSRIGPSRPTPDHNRRLGGNDGARRGAICALERPRVPQ